MVSGAVLVVRVCLAQREREFEPHLVLEPDFLLLYSKQELGIQLPLLLRQRQTNTEHGRRIPRTNIDTGPSESGGFHVRLRA
jgi:hypothetical protein